MLKLSKSCNVCKAVKQDKKLLNLIYNSNFYSKRSSISLMSIHTDYADLFSYRSLLGHVKNHQFMSEDDFNNRTLKDIAKQAEKQILRRKIESTEVWDEVIGLGVEQLKSGEITMKASDLLKAAKDKSDYELKTKDQEIAIAEMMWHFASGENKESRSYDRRIVESEAVTSFDATEGITNETGGGTDQSSDIYHTIPWDALAQGSGEIPDGNDSEQK